MGEPRPDAGHAAGQRPGTQYRSAIYCSDATQLAQAQASQVAYQQALKAAGYGAITTEVAAAGPFFYAEEYHQQYLAKNPDGYCGLGGTDVACPVGVAAAP